MSILPQLGCLAPWEFLEIKWAFPGVEKISNEPHGILALNQNQKTGHLKDDVRHESSKTFALFQFKLTQAKAAAP